jgi:hypothetical protein
MQNMLLEIPYKFKKSYGGTPEPQTTQDMQHSIMWGNFTGPIQTSAAMGEIMTWR